MELENGFSRKQIRTIQFFFQTTYYEEETISLILCYTFLQTLWRVLTTI
jgi:hypothetical protein